MDKVLSTILSQKLAKLAGKESNLFSLFSTPSGVKGSERVITVHSSEAVIPSEP